MQQMLNVIKNNTPHYWFEDFYDIRLQNVWSAAVFALLKDQKQT